jgi:hypothetical protein
LKETKPRSPPITSIRASPRAPIAISAVRQKVEPWQPPPQPPFVHSPADTDSDLQFDG